MLCFSQSFAQKYSGAIQQNPQFSQAQEMFDAENYVAAQKLFKTLYADNELDNYTEKSFVVYGLAICNKKLGDYDFAEKYLLEFVNDYPESVYLPNARFELAKLYFEKKSYKAAIDAYDKVNLYRLNDEEKHEYFYQTGYAYLKTNKIDKAATAFYEIKDFNGKYSKAATYYYAQISFEQANYESALQAFRNLENDKEFGESAKQFAMRILYEQGKYDEVVEYSKTMNLSKGNKKEIAENDLIIADSYFQLKDYANALRYFGKNNQRYEADENYKIGYSYFMLNEFDKALPNFEKAANSKDELKQNSLYHIGLCNLKLNNKSFAATSFRDAAKMDFNNNVKENALFNYVGIIYETGFDPYNDAISILQNFIEQNPKSPRVDEANSFLAKLFLSTKNYKNAIATIDKIDVKSPELKLAHQKITYSNGIDLFNARNYKDAINLFTESRKYALDKSLRAASLFWAAECNSRLLQFNNAIPLYKEFLSSPQAYDLEEYNYANYALAYSYFKQKNYSSAESYFRKFISARSHSDKAVLSDAWNRIGDCYFIQNQYAQAVKSYDEAIKTNSGNIDYAHYYKALALGATGNLKGKENALKEIGKMPVKTTYRSSAFYELANTYTLLDENANAIAAYKKVIAEYPKSPYAIKSKQKLGLLYYAERDYNEAISYLKDIVVSYPGTLEANECLASLKNVYIELNKVDDYMDFVTNSAKLKVTVTEADSMSFASAQNTFAAAKYTEAKKLLNNYLVNFKDGAFTPIVYYYLGECFFMENDYDNALKYYQIAGNFTNSLYQENAKMQSAKIYFHNEDYKSSAKIYEEIAKNTEYDFVAKDANIGLMRSYLEIPEYNKLLPAAKLVRAISDLDEHVLEEAELNIALAQQGLGLYSDAYASFNSLANKYKSETGAEAKYFCAFISYINADYTKAEKEVFELINGFGNYDYWLARGFILLGDIYVKTDNVFQAKQTYQSIIDNYSGDDLKGEAQEKLNALNK